MLNEPTSSLNNRPAARGVSLPAVEPEDSLTLELRAMVETVFMIDRETYPTLEEMPTEDAVIALSSRGRFVASYEGHLIGDSEAAYAQLDDLLRPTNHLALFRESEGRQYIHIVSGRADPKPRAWWPNLLLLVATLFSVLLVGMEIALNELASRNIFEAQRIAQNGLAEIWRGLPYALSIMLILGGHELGHYFAARRHHIAVTLPYFIPLPFISPFGTLGAFIQLRQPLRNRKILMDVGAAGPLAGLIFAVPILLIGLASIPPHPINTLGGVYEGDSILYATAKIITYGRFVPDGQFDVCINCNQLAWAGWTGLLVTALNLFPLGQLDGGHIIFSALGDRARKLYYPLMGVMVLLTLFVSSTWWLWLLMLLFLGQVYAAPLDSITQLDKPRRWVALASFVIFVLIFVPAPMTQIGGGGVLNGGSLAMVLPAVPLAAWRLRIRRALRTVKP